MSDVIKVELDEANRILIPPDLQKRLGLSPGMMLVVEKEQSGVALHIQPEMPIVIDKGGVLVAAVELVEDITDIVHRERERQALDPSQREDA